MKKYVQRPVIVEAEWDSANHYWLIVMPDGSKKSVSDAHFRATYEEVEV